MRAVSVAIATVLVGLASAQTGNLGIPSCANSCIGSFGKCGGFDAQCICTDKSLIANLACCVSVSCDKADQDSTLTFAQGICASYNADLPQSASCAPGAQSTPVTGSATAGSSSTAPSGSGSSATTTADESSSSASGASASAASASGSASASASASSSGNAGVRNEKVDSGLGLGLALAGLFAAI